MPLQIVTLDFNNPVNASLQVGDVVCYSTLSSSGGFSTVLPSNTTELGKVIFIDPNNLSINVIYDNAIPIPQSDDYITFAKDKEVNSSSLIGYYAEVEFTNNSAGKVEMFSVGSEVSESSK
jgi:hypothetical protein